MIVDIPNDGIVPYATVSSNQAASLLGVIRPLVISWIQGGKLDAFRQRPRRARRSARPAWTYYVRLEDVTELAAARRGSRSR